MFLVILLFFEDFMLLQSVYYKLFLYKGKNYKYYQNFGYSIGIIIVIVVLEFGDYFDFLELESE